MPFVGLHIHKTAGTSLLRYFEQQVPFRLYGAYSLRNFRLLELPLWASTNLTSRDIFWGHAIYESFFYDVAKPLNLFTFLRDPSERIHSWYSMLKRRKKLKKSAASLEMFATSHANSICLMLVTRFPSLVGDPTASLSDQALSVLEHMGFVGFQCHYSSHLPQMLEWMQVPISSDTVNARHNTAKRALKIDPAEQRLLDQLNEEDNRLYTLAFQRYADQPLNPERQVNLGSLLSNSAIDRQKIRTRQTKNAQRKFINSLRHSLGDVGVEAYLRSLNKTFGQCEYLLDKALAHSNSESAED
ncbi:MAG: hypothetical protein WBM08_09790 [Prochlorococcaceae cyanobacterium]